MPTLEKNEILELEILKHVEETPKLNNRIAASKLGCSVKLAHALLKKMVERGWLHIHKHHARRWDYFLTPTGITEKARLTYEFLDFSMQFYHEARKKSSQLCKDLATEGKKNIALLGAGELAEIAYLGIKEWNLTLHAIYDDIETNFLGHQVKLIADIKKNDADAIINCIYDKNKPMSKPSIPEIINLNGKLYTIFI